jgi:glycosyltransferase involved in cell wall biosynthesis
MIHFGIVMPTFNRASMVEKSIQSIVENSYQNWTLCIVDDGSDNIKEYKSILEKYKEDKRIKYHRFKENRGVNSARNYALDILINDMRCDYITFLDDDDIFTSDALEIANKKILSFKKHKWFVSLCADMDLNPITKVDKFGSKKYIDYFSSIGMSGDATHFISSELIQDIRFHNKIKNGYEWTFFIQINEEMFVYEHISMLKVYLSQGLTKGGSKLSESEKEILDDLSKKYKVTKSDLKRRYFIYRLKKAFVEKDIYNILKYSIRYPFGV